MSTTRAGSRPWPTPTDGSPRLCKAVVFCAFVVGAVVAKSARSIGPFVGQNFGPMAGAKGHERAALTTRTLHEPR